MTRCCPPRSWVDCKGWEPSLPARSPRWASDPEKIGRLTKSAQIKVRLRPRGSREELTGLRDGVLQAKVTASPVDGKANRALCRLIAKRVGVAPSKVSVIRGEKSREKLVAVEGLDSEELRRTLAGL